MLTIKTPEGRQLRLLVSLLLLTDFTPFSTVSVVDFEHVFV